MELYVDECDAEPFNPDAVVLQSVSDPRDLTSSSLFCDFTPVVNTCFHLFSRIGARNPVV